MKKIFLSVIAYVLFCFLVVPPTNANPNSEMEGETPPTGSLITGTSYPSTPAINAIDGNLNTYWNSGSTTGSIDITFPSPLSISGVQIAANASPATNEDYIIYGLFNGKWNQISSPSTQYVNWNQNLKPTILEPIPVTPALYDGIRIQVNAGSSWVAISEVTLLPAQICPEMDGIMPPKDTIITGGSYHSTPAINAIDCNLTSYWNSGNTTGSLDLIFPSSISISAVQIAANASPATNEDYIIYGLLNGSWNQISSPSTQYVNWNQNLYPTILEPIPVTPAQYDGIRIQVDAGGSWVAISEISLITGNASVPSVPITNKNLIPAMKSNNSPKGLVEFSNARFGDGYLAFNRIDNNVGWSPSSKHEWLSYKFETPQVITKYTIKPVNHPVGPARAPKDWTFEGFDGNSWTILDTRTEVTDWKAIVANEFTFSNGTAYEKYRIYVLNNNGDPSYLSIGEIEMMTAE